MTATSARRMRQLKRHAERIRDEGQGVWQMEEIHPRGNFSTMIARASAGQHRAHQVIDVTYQLIDAILAAPVDKPMVCLTCDTGFNIDALPEAVVLVHAMRDDADRALVHGICLACCRRRNQAELETAVTDTLRRLLINDLKRLPAISPPGHA